MADARRLLDWLSAQGHALFVRRGDAAAAWAALEAGLLEVCGIFAGLRPARTRPGLDCCGCAATAAARQEPSCLDCLSLVH